jgi:hypothetical protein
MRECEQGREKEGVRSGICAKSGQSVSVSVLLRLSGLVILPFGLFWECLGKSLYLKNRPGAGCLGLGACTN